MVPCLEGSQGSSFARPIRFRDCVRVGGLSPFVKTALSRGAHNFLWGKGKREGSGSVLFSLESPELLMPKVWQALSDCLAGEGTNELCCCLVLKVVAQEGGLRGHG